MSLEKLEGKSSCVQQIVETRVVKLAHWSLSCFYFGSVTPAVCRHMGMMSTFTHMSPGTLSPQTQYICVYKYTLGSLFHPGFLRISI